MKFITSEIATAATDKRSTNASAKSFNAKIKAFRATQRGELILNFFLLRLAKFMLNFQWTINNNQKNRKNDTKKYLHPPPLILI